MNHQTNLAFKLDDDTDTAVLGTAELNAQELDALLRLSSHRADVEVRPRAARTRRFAPVTFRDNHSHAFRPFKIY